jgi:nucleoid-associated protein YgaU
LTPESIELQGTLLQILREPKGEAHIMIGKLGDTLSHTAQRDYGDPSRWHSIYAANRDKLSSPDLIDPGLELVIPESR